MMTRKSKRYEFNPEVMAAVQAAMAAAEADIQRRYRTWGDNDHRFIGYGLVEAAGERAYTETVARLKGEGRI